MLKMMKIGRKMKLFVFILIVYFIYYYYIYTRITNDLGVTHDSIDNHLISNIIINENNSNQESEKKIDNSNTNSNALDNNDKGDDDEIEILKHELIKAKNERKQAEVELSNILSPNTLSSLDSNPLEQVEQADNGIIIEERDPEPHIIETLSFTESPITPFPIVLLCHNRADLLKQTIESLLKVRHVRKDMILVSQDGDNQEVANVVKNFDMELIQRHPTIHLRGADGGANIAMHYKFSLAEAFNKFSNAKAIVVCEDDFLFSPDFMEYFVSVAPIIEKDETLWIASAWNDNGFQNRVSDPAALRRTNFFPGLGWLLLRSIYEKELASTWPNNHWDWYIRSPNQHKDRECIYPEMPRVFHTGSKGTFMDLSTHEKYFAKIAYYNNEEKINFDAESILHENYEKRMEDLIINGLHIKTVKQFINIVKGNEKDDQNAVMKAKKAIIIWFSADPNPSYERNVIPFTEIFGVWHQLLRGSHEATIEIWFEGFKVLLVNLYEPPAHLRGSRFNSHNWFSGYSHPTIYKKFYDPNIATTFDTQAFATEYKAMHSSFSFF